MSHKFRACRQYNGVFTSELVRSVPHKTTPRSIHRISARAFPHLLLAHHFDHAPINLFLLDFMNLTPPQCFDQTCQRTKDAIFLVSLTFPLLGFIALASLFFKRSPPEGIKTFDDPSTGAVFETFSEPARDKKGELAYKAISYTPWPVVADADIKSMEPQRIDVGPINALQPRTYLFEKILPQPSILVAVQLSRPLGIVFEEDEVNTRAVVGDIVPGSNADQLMRRAALDPKLSTTSPLKGDILRACTSTNIVYRTGALMFGAQTPERALVVYGADGQRWPQTIAALKRGLVSDGKVTLILERRLEK